MGEFVNLEVDGGIGTIRLNRPPVNALNKQLQVELQAASDEAAARDDVRAVIVYGGPKVFAAARTSRRCPACPTWTWPSTRRRCPARSARSRPSRSRRSPRSPVTRWAAAWRSRCAATGGSRGDNVKLGQPEILLGIIPGGGGTQRLARLIGPAKAKDLIYTGRFVRADEALAIGLVDEVVAPDDVYAAARTWAGQFVNGPARALAAAKAAIDGGLDTDLANGLKLETYLFAALFATEDQREGMRSFIENGPGQGDVHREVTDE